MSSCQASDRAYVPIGAASRRARSGRQFCWCRHTGAVIQANVRMRTARRRSLLAGAIAAVLVVAGLAALVTVAVTQAMFTLGSEPGTSVTEVRNDLGVPVWMAVCMDQACKRPADGGGLVAPGETFPQAVSSDDYQVFVLRGLPAGMDLGSAVGIGSDRCVALETSADVLPEYRLSSFRPC